MRVRDNNVTIDPTEGTMLVLTHDVDSTISDPKTTESTQTTSGGSEFLISHMEDIVTPRYKERIGRGEVINNPMYQLDSREIYPALVPWNYVNVNVYGEDGLDGYTQTGVTSLDPFVFLGEYLEVPSSYASDVESLTNKAVTDAHASLGSSEIQALSTLAEGRKTIESVASIVTRLIKILRAVKRLDAKYLKRQLTHKELQDRYMELRYAIRPLVIDMKQATAAVTESQQWKNVRSTARGFAETSYSNNVTDPIEVWGWSFDRPRSVNIETKIRAGVLADVQTSTISVFGLDQPVEMLWEITPFSFIADWFFNIAKTLAAWTPNVGVKELASWVVVNQTLTCVNSVENMSPIVKGNYSSQFSIGKQVKSYTEHIRRRTVNPNLSVLPQTQLRLNSLKLIDLAIILQKFR